MKLYVGNLPFTLTAEELEDAFNQFGEVRSVNIVEDKYTGQSKGFGFIEMDDKEAALEAVQALNESALNGRNIRVNQAKPRGDKRRRH